MAAAGRRACSVVTMAMQRPEPATPAATTSIVAAHQDAHSLTAKGAGAADPPRRSESRRLWPPLSPPAAFPLNFIQTVRRLEARTIAAGAPPVGHARISQDEKIRFRGDPRLSFPLTDVEVDHVDGTAIEVFVRFFSLYGVSGVLPRADTIDVLEALHGYDGGPAAFLDIFNHRQVSLFYRAATKHLAAIAFERDLGTQNEPLIHMLLALAGVIRRSPGRHSLAIQGARGLPAQDADASLDEASIIRFVGHLSRRTRPVRAIEAMLSDLFAVPVEIEMFWGRWQPLAETDRTRLGGPSPEDSNASLGSSTILGDAYWDVQSTFRVILGPMQYDQFRQFLPFGADFHRLCAMVKNAAGLEFDFDVQLLLAPGDSQPTRLGAATPDADASVLGWNCWLGESPPDSGCASVVISGRRHTA
ncbi:MAG: type VI secretion system baseplate subunit TssG [Planctomycetota bacterium]